MTRKIFLHSLGRETCAGLYGYCMSCGSYWEAYEEAVEVGTVPHREEAADRPVRLLGAPLLGAGSKEIVEMTDEAAHIVLGRVKVSAGTGVSWRLPRRNLQLEEVVGDLRGEDAGDPVVLLSAFRGDGGRKGVRKVSTPTWQTITASTDRRIPVSSYWSWRRRMRSATDESSSGWTVVFLLSAK